jgi:hypothetical protein
MTARGTWPPAARGKSGVVSCTVRPARIAMHLPPTTNAPSTWAAFRPAASCGRADEQSASRHSPARRTLTSPSDTYIVPALIADAGDAAGWRYVEFFTANIRNPHTRRAYARACHRDGRFRAHMRRVHFVDRSSVSRRRRSDLSGAAQRSPPPRCRTASCASPPGLRRACGGAPANVGRGGHRRGAPGPTRHRIRHPT